MTTPRIDSLQFVTRCYSNHWPLVPAVMLLAVILAAARSSAADDTMALPTPHVPQVSVSVCSFIQSDLSSPHGRFEAVVKEGGLLVHYYRHTNVDHSPWVRAGVISRDAAGPGCLIQSDFKSGGPRRFDVLVPEWHPSKPGQMWLMHYVNYHSGSGWIRVGLVALQTTGPASFIQSDFIDDMHRRFDAVVMEENPTRPDRHRLVHYRSHMGTWVRGEIITEHATGPGSVIQSDFWNNGHRNFELVVPEYNRLNPERSKLTHYYHQFDPNGSAWVPSATLTRIATGPGSLISSDFVNNGHRRFEVVVPERPLTEPVRDRLVHYRRINDDPRNPWLRVDVIGEENVRNPAASIIQSDFTAFDHGNLEVVSTRYSPTTCHSSYPCITHHWRANYPASDWQFGRAFAITGRSQKICQVIGNLDNRDEQWWNLSDNLTAERYGIRGSDLGFSFEHKERYGNRKLYFFFGDTAHDKDGDACIGRGCDSYAWSDDQDPEDCLSLHFFSDAKGTFRRLAIEDPAISLKGFEVPAGGFSAPIGGTPLSNMFVFATTDCTQRQDPGGPNEECKANDEDAEGDSADADRERRVPRSVLAVSLFGEEPFRFLYNVSQDTQPWDDTWTAKFIKVSAVVVNRKDIPGLPGSGDRGVLLWGTGRHRKSDVYLAYMPLFDIGFPPPARNPTFVKLYYYHVKTDGSWEWHEGADSKADPVVRSCPDDAVGTDCAPSIGEVSVTWNKFLGKWLMLYDRSGGDVDPPSRKGIHFRIATNPWGPWSRETKIFDNYYDEDGNSNEDGGYCNFIMHANCCSSPISPYGWNFYSRRECCADWSCDGKPCCKAKGAAYAPYVIDRFTTGNANSTTIYYLLSTWEPYEVVLMRATLTW